MLAFYGIGQFLPIQLLFYFQFCKNKTSSINTDDDDSQLMDSMVENKNQMTDRKTGGEGLTVNHSAKANEDHGITQ